MVITGPHLDPQKKSGKQPKPWYLRYTAPKTDASGALMLNSNGSPMLKRHRPFYKTKAAAEADKPRILEQHATAGSGTFLFDRGAAEDYEVARKIVGVVPLVEVAKFWRLHHPEGVLKKLGEWQESFLSETELRLGKTRQIEDLKSRVGAFLKAGFSERYPETITRNEVLDYILRGLKEAEPRTRRNHKTSICTFFAWLLEKGVVRVNPVLGIKRRQLPKETPKEIQFLFVDQMRRYLRAAERYAPHIVAHETVQLIAGVRADDEMENFRAEFVLPATREVVIPADIAKTGKREVIDSLEKSFWSWWSEYGPKEGLIRPKNYLREWRRIRFLATIEDRDKADEYGRVPIKRLLKLPEVNKALEDWPWNARRRTFCTHHVAKHQSAARTALILRHRGSAATLHNSYRGLGVSQAQGKEYFAILPEKSAGVIRPLRPVHGVAVAEAESGA